MNRNITLYNEEPSKKDNFSEYIDIKSIDNIINSSVDNLFCDCLESIEEAKLNSTIQTLTKKIRPNGYLNIKIQDTKKICLDYLQNKIENKEFIELFNNKNSILSLDTISTNIDHSIFITSKINSDNYMLSITLFRKPQI